MQHTRPALLLICSALLTNVTDYFPATLRRKLALALPTGQPTISRAVNSNKTSRIECTAPSDSKSPTCNDALLRDVHEDDDVLAGVARGTGAGGGAVPAHRGVRPRSLPGRHKLLLLGMGAGRPPGGQAAGRPSFFMFCLVHNLSTTFLQIVYLSFDGSLSWQFDQGSHSTNSKNYLKACATVMPLNQVTLSGDINHFNHYCALY